LGFAHRMIVALAGAVSVGVMGVFRGSLMFYFVPPKECLTHDMCEAFNWLAFKYYGAKQNKLLHFTK